MSPVTNNCINFPCVSSVLDLRFLRNRLLKTPLLVASLNRGQPGQFFAAATMKVFSSPACQKVTSLMWPQFLSK